MDAEGNSSGVFATSENQELQNAGKAGYVTIEASKITLVDGGRIDSSTYGTGQSGSINIQADFLTLDDQYSLGSGISANSNSEVANAGNAGDIKIAARQLTLTNGSQINSFTSGGGQGGTIHLQVSETLTISGKDAKGNRSSISASSYNQGLEKAGNAGSLKIEAPQIVLTNGGRLNSSTYGTGQGGSIILKGVDTLTVSGSLDNGTFSQIMATSNNKELTHAGDAGNIEIEARQINLTENGQIGSATRGSGQGGKVILRGVDTLISTGEQSVISSNSLGSQENSGNTGDILIDARQLTITNGGQIASNTYGAGRGGSIILKGVDTLVIGGTDTKGYMSGVFATSENQKLEKSGKAGNIIIEAHQITLTSGIINSSTYGVGQGGLISIQADSLIIDGKNSFSTISANSNTEVSNAGDAGQINIATRQLMIINKGQINSFTYGTGQGGSISIQADSLIIDAKNGFSSIAANSSNKEISNAGNAGQINIAARQLTLSNGAQINSLTRGSGRGGAIRLDVSGVLSLSGESENNYSSINCSSKGENSNAGQAGQLSIQANQLHLTDGGRISTETNNAGGGDINLSIPNLLYLHKGEISTSVKNGTSDGGNITIGNPQFVVSNIGQIKAQADAGHGGNIRIAAQHFIPSVESLVSASSNLGIDGQISIESPTEDIGSQVLSLSAKYLNAASLFPRSCAARIADQRPSEFVRPFTLIVRPKTMVAAPEDTRASPYPVTMHYKWFDQYR